MNNLIKYIFLILTITVYNDLFSQGSKNLSEIEIYVYDGYEYFNFSRYVPINNAKISYNKIEKTTDALGHSVLVADKESEIVIVVSAINYEGRIVKLRKRCDIDNHKIEVFLGLHGTYYGYIDNMYVPFDLRENSFSFFVNEKNKTAALAVIPEKYQSTLIVRPLDKVNRDFLIIVNSVPISELRVNNLFNHLRQTGAKVSLISKDLKKFVNASFWVQPCDRIKRSQLRDEILSKYPELHIEFDDLFSSALKIILPQDVLLDVFEWSNKLSYLENVARITIEIDMIVSIND